MFTCAEFLVFLGTAVALAAAVALIHKPRLSPPLAQPPPAVAFHLFEHLDYTQVPALSISAVLGSSESPEPQVAPVAISGEMDNRLSILALAVCAAVSSRWPSWPNVTHRLEDIGTHACAVVAAFWVLSCWSGAAVAKALPAGRCAACRVGRYCRRVARRCHRVFRRCRRVYRRRARRMRRTYRRALRAIRRDSRRNARRTRRMALRSADDARCAARHWGDFARLCVAIVYSSAAAARLRATTAQNEAVELGSAVGAALSNIAASWHAETCRTLDDVARLAIHGVLVSAAVVDEATTFGQASALAVLEAARMLDHAIQGARACFRIVHAAISSRRSSLGPLATGSTRRVVQLRITFQRRAGLVVYVPSLPMDEILALVAPPSAHVLGRAIRSARACLYVVRATIGSRRNGLGAVAAGSARRVVQLRITFRRRAGLVTYASSLAMAEILALVTPPSARMLLAPLRAVRICLRFWLPTTRPHALYGITLPLLLLPVTTEEQAAERAWVEGFTHEGRHNRARTAGLVWRVSRVARRKAPAFEPAVRELEAELPRRRAGRAAEAAAEEAERVKLALEKAAEAERAERAREAEVAAADEAERARLALEAEAAAAEQAELAKLELKVREAQARHRAAHKAPKVLKRRDAVVMDWWYDEEPTSFGISRRPRAPRAHPVPSAPPLGLLGREASWRTPFGDAGRLPCFSVLFTSG